MCGVHLGAFWDDFGAVWDPFGRSKVRKSGPKSIPKINRIFDIEISWFSMICGRYVKSKTYVLHWFFNGFVQIVFFQKVGPQDQQSSVFGAQNDPESELWADISGPKIDENSGSKKKGSQIEKSDPKKQSTILGESLFGSQGPRKRTLSLNTIHSQTVNSYLTTPLG